VRPTAATGLALSGFAVRRARFCGNIAKRAKVLRPHNLEREVGMYPRCRNILFLAIFPSAIAAPAAGQTASSHEPTPGVTTGAAIPDFSGIWRHPSLPGFEPPASGPGPVTNRVRRTGSRQPGASNYDRLVGDYTNPILKPHAADLVKKYGDLSLNGITYGNPANQCWPEPIPFIFKHFGMQMLQEPHQITMIYSEDNEVRHVRMNASHPARLTQSWHGDSIGHYEGDTLVIDTVGQKTDRPFAMVDLYGTPYTEKLHVVERYRLLDYEDAKEGLDRDAKENFIVQEGRDPNYRGKHLQVHFTVEDEGVFTTPWTATITYGRSRDYEEWVEIVCAENRNEYYNKKESAVPKADKPDF
jgi:hypothetical protein